MIDGFLPKLEELVEWSKGKIRADVAHEKITAMGYAGARRYGPGGLVSVSVRDDAVSIWQHVPAKAMQDTPAGVRGVVGWHRVSPRLVRGGLSCPDP